MSVGPSTQSAFARLHPVVQYHVVNSLRWPALRPLQEQAIPPLLAGEHALLLAPTAGGKTEAAVLPILSRMLTEEWRGLSVLYICPIKALLNNLEPRLAYLAGLVGRRVAVWHGDVGQGAKSRAESDLPDILLTTPESLEGLLIGSRRDHLRVLGGVRTVIIDELHAFAADDRGWHLMALLERLRDLGAPLNQRIGLSATVGDPQALLIWLSGHVDGTARLVQVAAPPVQVDLGIDHVGNIANAAVLISRLHAGEKRLVFCDSRTKVEALSVALRERGVDVFVSHAALSADLRQQAEQAFSERRNCVIVATSTLELGLDVGDLDRVIQIDAPGSVASFVQRLGRTGRRPGTTRNTLFVATTDEGLLEALAITSLFRHGYVEPVTPPLLPCHVLVQQLFASMVEHGRELDEARFLQSISRIPGFREVVDLAWVDIRAHLLKSGYLVRHGMLLGFGPLAEKMFCGKGLADLCVSFDSPRTFAVMHGVSPVGHVDPLGLMGAEDLKRRVLALGGRSWCIESVDYSRGRIHVVPSTEHGSSRWTGVERGESRAIAQAIKQVLTDPTIEAGAQLSRRASERLAVLRSEMEGTLRGAPIGYRSHSYAWWTYSGLAANRLLVGRIAAAGGHQTRATSWNVDFSIDATSLDRIGGWKGLEAIDPRWQPDVVPKFAELLPPATVSAMTLARTKAKAGIEPPRDQAAPALQNI